MFDRLLKKTPVMERDTPRAHTVFTVLAVISALTMFVAASGSGNPDTAEPLPDWVNIAANVVSAAIGLLVLLPATRVYGAVLAIVNMALSMAVNYTVDGPGYFALVLPFNLVSIAVAALLVRHYRDDLLRKRAQ